MDRRKFLRGTGLFLTPVGFIAAFVPPQVAAGTQPRIIGSRTIRAQDIIRPVLMRIDHGEFDNDLP